VCEKAGVELSIVCVFRMAKQDVRNGGNQSAERNKGKMVKQVNGEKEESDTLIHFPKSPFDQEMREPMFSGY
jgi:hypothetical protein